MKFGTKLFLAFLAVALIPFSILATISLTNSTSALSQSAFNHLESVRDMKRAAVTRYFTTVQHQLRSFAEDRMVVDAMQQFTASATDFRVENKLTTAELNRMKQQLYSYYANEFSNEYRQRNAGQAPDIDRSFSQLDDDSIALQYQYIRANHHPLGSKEQLDYADDRSRYSALHRQIHPIIRNFLERFGYYDIFLVDCTSGDIVYSVFKELDYTTSLLTGPYAQTNFGEAFRRANALTNGDEVVIVDYARYTPSYEAPAGFVACPIFDGPRKVGIAMFQFPIDRLNSIMTERSGLGETGETYLVGSDKLMRSDSFLDPDKHSVQAAFTHPASGSVDTRAAQAALAGHTGTELIIDYNGNPVLSAYCPLVINDIRWALMAEIDEAEAFASSHRLKGVIAMVAAFCLAAVIASALLLTRSTTRPIQRVIALLNDLQQGRLQSRLRLQRKDELGQLAASLDTFADNLQHEVVTAFDRLAAGDFTFKANGVIQEPLARANQSINSMMLQVQSSSLQIAAGSSQVAGSSQSLSQGATEQASSLEQISASMTEINSQIHHNADNAAQASQLALATKAAAEKGDGSMREMVTAMAQINDASSNISKIIKVIDEIAFQTNLLALNAAVEAARAGQHGKGFAVVAEEVRNLAARSARAAQETTDMIESSVSKAEHGGRIAEETASALHEIVQQVTKVTQLVDDIAEASNEQTEGVSQISQGLNQIDQVTQMNTATAEESAASAEQLSNLSQQLRQRLSQFTLADHG